MSESSPDRIAASLTSRERMSRGIAGALGPPEAVFHAEDGSGFRADPSALLPIRSSPTDHADRQRILAYARPVAAERSGAVRP